MYMVLIETLWNVNDINVFNLLEEAFSINRNIVECKFSISGDTLVVVGRINRNIVECKYKTG